MVTSKLRHIGKENLIYAGFWAIFFITPVVSLYIRSSFTEGISFDWNIIFMIWKVFLLYLAIFIIHDFFIAPRLVYAHKKWAYVALTAVMVLAFVAIQTTFHPADDADSVGLPPIELSEGDTSGHSVEASTKGGGEHPVGHGASGSAPHDFGRPPREAMDVYGRIDLLGAFVLIGLLGMNVGVKFFFKSTHDREELRNLERQNLEQRIEYLKYQINPHFFMNTLNNIHALIDIDKEEAKYAVIELSRMMRYVLYESNKPMVSLKRENDFINCYVGLMRLRFTDRVSISVSLAPGAEGMMVAPLVFIAFVENAFKHGISYENDSFVSITTRIDDGKIYFCCSNSKHAESIEKHGGVGLRNVRRRLELIYGDDYSLDIDDSQSTYSVSLRIPLNTNKSTTA